jgi:hypothetical protein
MIYMWFTGINYYILAVEKDRDSIFTTITIICIMRGRGGGGGVSSRNHEDHFSISRVTKNKISFSRFFRNTEA